MSQPRRTQCSSRQLAHPSLQVGDLPALSSLEHDLPLEASVSLWCPVIIVERFWLYSRQTILSHRASFHIWGINPIVGYLWRSQRIGRSRNIRKI